MGTDESETDDTVISRFLESLQRQVRYINSKLQKLRNKHKLYSLREYEANREVFEAEEKCSICNLPFDNDVHSKVFHHDHYNGKYLSACCNVCNQNMECVEEDIPIFFHNYKGYDSHHILRNLKIDEWKEVMSEENIYYLYDSKTNEVKLHRDRFEILNNYLSKPNYNYYRGVLEKDGYYSNYENKDYYVYLVCEADVEIPQETFLIDEKENRYRWLINDDKIEEIKDEIDRLNDLKSRFEKQKGKKNLAKKSREEVIEIFNAFHSYFKGDEVTFYGPETSTKDKILDDFEKLKRSHLNTYQKEKKFDVIMENKQKMKTMTFRGMRFLDSLAFFGQVGSSLDSLSTTIKYQQDPPNKFKDIVNVCRANNKRKSENELEEMTEEEREAYE